MINDKAMIVLLNIRTWSARKYDREISKEIEAIHNSGDSGRYNKLLIERDAVNKIAKMATGTRCYHYANTLPWLDTGGRLLPATNYFNYMQEIRRLKDEFEYEVSNFLDTYLDLKDKARDRLSDMYNEDDYPSQENLSVKYSFNTQIMPVPTADDFRVNLNDEEVEVIKESIEEQLRKSTAMAMQDLWKRLFEVVQHMVERLSKKKNKFKDSLVSNIVALCDILPKLNVIDDVDLNAAVSQIKEKLTAYDPQTLRDNKEARSETAIEAQKILDKMKSYYVN